MNNSEYKIPLPNVIESSIVRNLPEDTKKIIIFGCDDGRLSFYIKEKFKDNVQITGVEKNIELVNISKNYVDKIFVSSVDDFDTDDIYDCLIYYDINKNVENPFNTINKHKKSLKDKGIIFFSFFNNQYFKYIEDLITSGLNNHYFLLKNISKFPYNLKTFDIIITSLNLYIKSCLGIVSPLFNILREVTPNLNLGKIGRINIQNEISFFNFLSYYFLITVTNIKDTYPFKIESIEFSDYDLKSFMYRHLKDYWEDLGKYYYYLDSPGLCEGNLHQLETEYFAKKIADLKPLKILEIGCGYGRNLKEIRRKCPNAEIIGLDISSNQLEKAHNYLEKDNIKLIQYTEKTPFPFEDNYFDVVFTSGVLCICYPEIMNQIRQEMKRVSNKYIVHNEDTRVQDIRFFQYDYEKIYKDEGCIVELIEQNPHFSSYKIIIVKLMKLP